MKFNFNFSIKLKLLVSLGLLMVLLIVMYRVQSNAVKASRTDVQQNIQYEYPSMIYAEKFKDLVANSQYLVTKWTLKCDARDLKLPSEIEACHGELKDSLKTKLDQICNRDVWSRDNYVLYHDFLETVDTLFGMQEELMECLRTADQFNDASNYSFRKYNVVEGEMVSCYKRAYSLASRLANAFSKSNKANLEYMDEGFDNTQSNLLYFVMGAIIIVVLIMVFINYIIGKLNYVKSKIKEMSDGILPDVDNVGTDEIGEMSTILKTLISNLKETSQFAIKIGEGDFVSEFHPQSKHDVLANSLLVMRDNLIKADKEAEQRKVENLQRNWAAQGLAEFNEVLRNAGDDMQVLSNRVVERLVRYLDANMGGIYILDDSDPADKHLELTAFYAYDRLKYVKQGIDIGENLVGQCFRENETVYMTDLPKGYVHISSGLGEADPTCLVIVPLKINGETYGIVELASFKIIEKYQVEFVEKIGETIASTIANVKININTQKLLEESHQKSERLSQQEAEVHKNIESLKSKIENLEDINKRESVKYQKLHDDFENQAETNQTIIQKLNEKNEQLKDEVLKNQFIINNSAGYYELDAQGFYTSMNARMLNVVDTPFQDIENHDIRSFMTKDEDIASFNEGLKRLADGLIYSNISSYSFNGKVLHLNETFTPIRDEYNVLLKICVVAKNYTSSIEKINELQNKILELQRDNDMLQQKVGMLGL